MKSEVWKDNTGVLIFSNIEPPRVTLRSNVLTYHWFRYTVKELSIGLNKIGTKGHLADILTKGTFKGVLQKA